MVKAALFPLISKKGNLKQTNNSLLVRCCPKLSRFKMLSLLAITFLSMIFLLFRCLSPALIYGQFLCCKQKVGQLGLSRNASAWTVFEEDYKHEGANHIRYKHTQRRLPQCLIIGVRKGGTRALLEFLNLHPRIQAAGREMHFFDDDENYSKGMEWYRKKMPWSFPGTITMEKTPAYFVSEETPIRAKKMNASMKFLIVFRDPTERAISDYTQIHVNKLQKNRYHESFETLAIDEDTGEVRRSYNAIRRSIYHRHMERWLEHFPLKQFHFVNGEKLVSNPVEELSKVEDFLELQHRITDENFYFNKTRGFFCVRNETSEKCLASSKGRKHPDIDPKIKFKLQEFFQPHNRKLYNLIGEDFGWP